MSGSGYGIADALVEGVGIPGTPSGGIVTVQGMAGSTPLNISNVPQKATTSSLTQGATFLTLSTGLTSAVIVNPPGLGFYINIRKFIASLNYNGLTAYVGTSLYDTATPGSPLLQTGLSWEIGPTYDSNFPCEGFSLPENHGLTVNMIASAANGGGVYWTVYYYVVAI